MEPQPSGGSTTQIILTSLAVVIESMQLILLTTTGSGTRPYALTTFLVYLILVHDL